MDIELVSSSYKKVLELPLPVNAVAWPGEVYEWCRSSQWELGHRARFSVPSSRSTESTESTRALLPNRKRLKTGIAILSTPNSQLPPASTATSFRLLHHSVHSLASLSLSDLASSAILVNKSIFP